jgi:AcrR family transcriptional regulator
MTSTTAQKLVQAIANHYLVAGGKRLLVSDVAKQAGITRQAFNRYYGHLKPYVTGKKPVAELLGAMDDGPHEDLLARSQQRIQELQTHVQSLLDEREKYRRDVERTYVTTLMNNDIVRFESNELRLLLEKQSRHNDVLLSQLKDLQLQLAKSRSDSSVGTITSKRGGRLAALVNPDFSTPFRAYAKGGDKEALEKAKDNLVTEAAHAVRKLTAQDSLVIVYLDRYLASFDTFAKGHPYYSEKSAIFVRLPLFTRTELRLFLRKIAGAGFIHVFYPQCDSKVVAQAQRSFMFRNAPACEIADADNAHLPTLADGCDAVTVLKVK